MLFRSFIKNKVIPDEIWPSPEMDAPWERYPLDYAKQLDEDLTHYMPSAEITPDSSPPSSSQNPQLSPSLQDSQDPYDLSPWSLSQVDEELLEADRQWERNHPEPHQAGPTSPTIEILTRLATMNTSA